MKLKGRIILEEVSSKEKGRYQAIFLRTKTYCTYELSDDFENYIGRKISIKIK